MSNEANCLQLAGGTLVMLKTNITAVWLVLVFAIIGSFIAIVTIIHHIRFLVVRFRQILQGLEVQSSH